MSASRLAQGATLGDFVVVRRVASGGMGELYEALQQSTQRRRAIKVMHEHIADDPSLRARFAREATVSAAVDSEHIVAVLAASTESDGLAWIAMEWLDGEDLAARLSDRRALSVAAVAALVAQLGHALGAAHRVGVVHRDLKPENVFLSRSSRADATVTVKLLDFGIARVVRDATLGRGTSTIGSPLWMAPEQYDPEAVVTAAADVWSLGLLVFRALTGAHYLRAVRAGRATSPEALMSEVLLGELPSASVRAAELAVEAVLPAQFDRWFARCVARDPSERFADGAAAAEAFGNLVAVEPDASGLSPSTAASRTVSETTSSRSAPTVPADRAHGERTPPGTRSQRARSDDQSEILPGHSQPERVAPPRDEQPSSRVQRRRAWLIVVAAIAVLAVLAGTILVFQRQSAGGRAWFAPWASQTRALVEPRTAAVLRCAAREALPLRAVLHFRADGTFVRAYVGPRWAGTETQICLENTMRNVRAPATGAGDAALPYTFEPSATPR